nr:hypothetical protein [Haliscomenobacter sp.]
MKLVHQIRLADNIFEPAYFKLTKKRILRLSSAELSDGNILHSA